MNIRIDFDQVYDFVSLLFFQLMFMTADYKFLELEIFVTGKFISVQGILIVIQASG